MARVVGAACMVESQSGISRRPLAAFRIKNYCMGGGGGGCTGNSYRSACDEVQISSLLWVSFAVRCKCDCMGRHWHA